MIGAWGLFWILSLAGFFFIVHYLALIAKFYRIKFDRGPSHKFFYMGMVPVISGLGLRLFFNGQNWLTYTGNVCIISGAVIIMVACWKLYGNLMQARR